MMLEEMEKPVEWDSASEKKLKHGFWIKGLLGDAMWFEGICHSKT